MRAGRVSGLGPVRGLTRVRALVLGALLVTGCGGVVPTEAPASTGPTGGPTATETTAPPETVGPPPTATPDDGTSPLAIDPELLAVLPAEVADIPVTESLDEATLALGNAVLQRVASAVDAAVAVDAGGGNLVYALVVRLRPGALGEAGFRDWRDSYDEGACAAAGLDIGHGQAEIDGRTVYIGTCQGGIVTYHVRLDAQGILISSWSLGEGRFGELLVSNLRAEG